MVPCVAPKSPQASSLALRHTNLEAHLGEARELAWSGLGRSNGKLPGGIFGRKKEMAWSGPGAKQGETAWNGSWSKHAGKLPGVGLRESQCVINYIIISMRTYTETDGRTGLRPYIYKLPINHRAAAVSHRSSVISHQSTHRVSAPVGEGMLVSDEENFTLFSSRSARALYHRAFKSSSRSTLSSSILQHLGHSASCWLHMFACDKVRFVRSVYTSLNISGKTTLTA